MDLNLILVCVVIAVALFFSYTNGFGFHKSLDASRRLAYGSSHEHSRRDDGDRSRENNWRGNHLHQPIR